MLVDTSLIYTQHFEVGIKCKMEGKKFCFSLHVGGKIDKWVFGRSTYILVMIIDYQNSFRAYNNSTRNNICL